MTAPAPISVEAVDSDALARLAALETQMVALVAYLRSPSPGLLAEISGMLARDQRR